MSSPPSDASQSREPGTSRSPPPPPPPPLDVRWLHAGAQYLDLPTNPVTSLNTTYKAFSVTESNRLEEAWWCLTDDERREYAPKGGKGASNGKATSRPSSVDSTNGNTTPLKAEEKDEQGNLVINSGAEASRLGKHRGDKEDGPKHGVGQAMMEKTATEGVGVGASVMEKTGSQQEDPVDHIVRMVDPAGKGKGMILEDLETVRGVPVSQDGLFEVSLSTMSLEPVFWAHTGPRVPVIRATWYIGDEAHPCEWELAEELERGYQEIKPYLPSYPDELQKAVELGSTAEDKLKFPLSQDVAIRHGGGAGTTVVYRDKDCGELVTVSSYLSKLFWSGLRSKSSGTMVYRGYAAAAAASVGGSKAASADASRARSRRGSGSSVRSTKSAGVGGKPGSESSSRRPSAVGGEKPRGLDIKDKSRLDDRSHRLERSTSRQSDGAVPAPKKTGLEGLKEGMQQAGEGIEESLRSAVGQPDVDGLREEQEPLAHEEEDDDECTDLILVIHGIGQQLASEYQAWNFVYAANILRQVMRQQAQNPALASIIRDRRVQVLPIQWRASLQIEQDNNEEDVVHGMDNRFTMADITLPKIPAIRQITNSVLLDIPLFMSQHRQAMIEAVCYQANRAYRLWCARNPNFDGRGRVHLIGHSLGSALAAHILSNQPTKMPTLSQLPKSVIASTKNQFLFNTSNLFLCGSPLGIFLHLDQAQIMPRKGRERTMHSPQDEALDRAGRFGCMSCDSLYNIVHLSDPIAYTLNAAVDAALAKTRPPLPITSVTSPFYSSVTDKLPAISQYLPSVPYFNSSSKEGGSQPKKPNMVRLPSGIEMSGPEGEERLQGSRAERRLSALNPHGNVDFVLPSGGVSDYLDALTSHASYWSDPNFGAFLLAEIFSTKLDMLRTGMGLANPGMMPEGIPL